ncbi:MAG: chromate transporter [Bryobacterales bacterium]|nr:chromate transporter [Bryobacterales bacterium]
MNALLLYFLLLKATLASFSGLSSLPAVRDDLVVRHAVLTDRQLNTAVAIARVSPGPFGLYLVPVGYYAGGWPGAVAGVAATITPAFFIVLLLRFAAARTMNPRVLAAISAVTYASAGLVLASVIPLARDALQLPWQALLAAAVALGLSVKDWDSLWAIAAGALCGLGAFFGRGL